MDAFLITRECVYLVTFARFFSVFSFMALAVFLTQELVSNDASAVFNEEMCYKAATNWRSS